jgi:1-phosphofructokinase family hexose kinase
MAHILATSIMIYTVTLNPAVDQELTVPVLAWDTVLRANKQRTDVGGKGFNVSRMVQKLGGESVALGFVGGRTGRVLEDGLHAHGITTDFVYVSEETRTNVSVVVEQGGRSLKVNTLGPNILPTEQIALVKKVLHLTTSGDWCVLCGSLPPKVSAKIYAELVTQLRLKGVHVILDASGEAFRLGCAAAPFLVTPNYSEALELSQESEAVAAARWIHSIGPSHVIVTLGCDGAMWVNEEAIEWLSSPTLDERNATGAGDALVGGMVFSLEQGCSLGEALRWGVACGSVAASLAGTEFGDRPTVESMMNQLTQRNYFHES